ncbi:hypothetical protein [Larkinella terrae]|uniref:Uncharacterized protein n=1 Tax=Larkinella terrae TaxID=2025311 RepID=A0A7K0EQ92_9BACT|nr:hypothetical protein [Larkinella terrae]MRS63969.1 hypothetical protein [Larkinella terrae]
MVEVFKTDVQDQRQAKRLIDQIQELFSDYTANFDLEDCDNILRVKSASGFVEACYVITVLRDFGFHAEVLPDDDLACA